MRRIAVFSLLVAGCTAGPPPQDGQRLKTDAEEAFLRGDYARAADGYQKYADTRPADIAWALLQLGRSFNGAEQWDRAVKAFSDCLAMHPPEEQRLQALYYRAIACGGAGKYRESLDDFNAAAAGRIDTAVPADEFAYRHALAKIRAGDWTGGQAALKAFTAAFPQSAMINDAKDRLALKSVCILLARAKDAAAAKTMIAGMKGVVAQAVAGARDVMIVTGSFKSAAEARAELPKVQAVCKDAFVVP